jgi:hypothetical protein
MKPSQGLFPTNYSLGAEIFERQNLERKEELRQNPDPREDK